MQNNGNFTEYKLYCNFVETKGISCKTNIDKQKVLRKKKLVLNNFKMIIRVEQNALSLLQIYPTTSKLLLFI